MSSEAAPGYTCSPIPVAVACDVRLGEMVRRNPELVQIDVDPEAAAAALRDLQVDGSAVDSLLIIAAHDDTVNGLESNAQPGLAEAYGRCEYQNSVLIPVGGGRDSFEKPFMLSLGSGAPYSRAVDVVREYSQPRGLHPTEVLSRLPDHLDILAYLNPTPRSEAVIQHIAIARMQQRAKLMKFLHSSEITNVVTAPQLLKEIVLMGGYMGAFYGGLEAGQAIAPESPPAIIGSIVLAMAAWRKVDNRFNEAKSAFRSRWTDIKRVEQAAHDPRIPSIVRFITRSPNPNN